MYSILFSLSPDIYMAALTLQIQLITIHYYHIANNNNN